MYLYTHIRIRTHIGESGREGRARVSGREKERTREGGRKEGAEREWWGRGGEAERMRGEEKDYS